MHIRFISEDYCGAHWADRVTLLFLMISYCGHHLCNFGCFHTHIKQDSLRYQRAHLTVVVAADDIPDIVKISCYGSELAAAFRIS